MARRSNFLRNITVVVAAAAFCPVCHAQAADEPVSAERRSEPTSKYGNLSASTTSEAPRDGNDTRTPFAAGIEGVRDGDDGSGLAESEAQQAISIEPKDHAATRVRHWEGRSRSDDGPFISHLPVSLVDGGPDGFYVHENDSRCTARESPRVGGPGRRGEVEEPAKLPPLATAQDDRREKDDANGQRETLPGTNTTTSKRAMAPVLLEDHAGSSTDTSGAAHMSEVQFAGQAEHDPWEGYQIIAQADPVESWEILREARLSYYTFKYDRSKGRRQLGVLPTEMARLLPEAFSTFTLPVQQPDGSRSRVDNVPNIDWTYLFAHTVAVTQAWIRRELKRRYDALDTKLDVLKAETENASLKLVRYMEGQGKEWQPAASLKELAVLSELKRDIVKGKLLSGEAARRERRRLLGLKHNQTLAIAEMELELAMTLAEEKTSLAVQNLREEQKGLEELIPVEESLRMATDVALLLLDMEAANQTAKLSSDRRLAEGLANLQATKEGEREGEALDKARIRAKGTEARRQTQAVIDETSAYIGSLVLATTSDPMKLARIMAAALGIAFAMLLVGNSVTLAAMAIRRRATKPRLVRESDLPGSPPAAVVAWISRRGRAVLLPLLGKSSHCRYVQYVFQA
ncbi:unnamed protein product [Ectocarpus fasciculatus]